MRSTIRTMVICACMSFASFAGAKVVTFEDVGDAGLQDGYGGISGWRSVGDVIPSFGEGLDNFHFYGQEGLLSFDEGPVIFQGTFYKSYAAQDGLVAADLFYQGKLVHSVADVRVPRGVEWLASGYAGLVDQIYLRGGIEGFAIDNLTYDSVGAVPEPASWTLLLAGIVAVGVLGRQRRAL